MKKNIQPKVEEVTVTCDCGNTFKVLSTKTDGINTEICNACHPFYTGDQSNKKARGRIEKFNKKFGMSEEAEENSKTNEEE